MRKTARQLDAEIAHALKRRAGHAEKKSPLKVACRPLAFAGMKACAWTVVGNFRGAEFVSRSRPSEFAIVHPSTKTAGKWQVSFFDDLGPSRDSQHSSAEDALKQVFPKKWKLKTAA